LEVAIDLAPAIVVVEESVQLRHHPSTGPHHDATNIVVIGHLVGDEDAVVLESAVGDEHMEVDVQLQASTPRFAYDMKRALPDGRRKLVMSGVELLDKLVPLIPPTYANLTRFITAR
jgi:hypothetical protein